MEDLKEKEKQNASKLQVLEDLNREATEIVEEQHQRLKEARLNSTTPLISEAETSEPENHGDARPKMIPRAKLTSVVPNTLLQESMVPTYSSYSRLSQKQLLEDHAVLLRDEVLNVIPGTMNTQHGTAS